MLLVDSSVWIDQLRGIESVATRFVAERDDFEDVAITAAIYQEVLQGANNDKTFARLRCMLDALTLLEPDGLSTYALAAQLYRQARGQGLTVRKPNDCLIAAIALEHGALLIHSDRDFYALASIAPQLSVFPMQLAQRTQ
jgi:predicted nucleic acid-binding protein